MKRWWLAGAMAVLAMGLGAGAGTVRAVPGSGLSTVGQQLDGTWLVTANLDAAPPGVPTKFMTLNTFFPDGALIDAGRPAAPTRTPIGHGQWVRAGDRLFTATFTFMTYDEAGQQTGMQQITRSIRLSEDLQEFRAVARNEQFDLEGKLVFRGGATETARRLAVGDPPPVEAIEGSRSSGGSGGGASLMIEAVLPLLTA